MTIREQILSALFVISQGVSGITNSSITRERVRPVQEDECPALDLSPTTESAPQSIGTGADKRNLEVEFKFNTAGSGAYALADSFVGELHRELYADETLGGLATGIIPGPTEFARDDADQTIGRTTVKYTIIYTTRRSDISAKAR